jgi:hypothetical protein
VVAAAALPRSARRGLLRGKRLAVIRERLAAHLRLVAVAVAIVVVVVVVVVSG